ncbi:MAG TPA: RNA polymerase factor sigma-54 [Bacteroidaceae bacterium]|nr:RNA polymerase factor sigma-54 [Bacteroidaceae bacterium]
MNRQTQTQTTAQTQTLAPQQILTVKLIELPIVEMEQRVRDELLDNPALEEARDNDEEEKSNDKSQEKNEEDTENELIEPSTEDILGTDDVLADYLTEDDIPDYRLNELGRQHDEERQDIPYSEGTSFLEYLNEQVQEQDLTEDESQLAKYIIGSLDNDGILRKSLTSIQDELAIYIGIEHNISTIKHVLSCVQSMDPPGIAARNLQECLLLQLQRLTPSVKVEQAIEIITHHFKLFTLKKWAQIQSKLGISDEDMKKVLHEITSLTPKPGASLGEVLGKTMQTIVPDFIVDTDENGQITMSLNGRGIPPLKISKEFRTIIEEHTKNKANQNKKSQEAIIFVKQKLQSAQGFIDAVKQRHQTLTGTMQAIIDLQRPFFTDGDEGVLQPMKLEDVAKITGLDISTISRVSNSKYVQTNFGIFPLKFFFNNGYQLDDGEELSVRRIKQALQDLIDNEDKTKPLADERLAQLMKDQGFPIARRTIAKYRDQLEIPVARLRKEK